MADSFRYGSPQRMFLVTATLVVSAGCFFDWDGPLGATNTPDGATDAAAEAGGDLCLGATFCETFDKAPLEPTWATFRTGGTFAVVPSATAVSPPNLFRVQSPAIMPPATGGAWIAKVLSTPMSVTELSFSVFPEVIDTSSADAQVAIAGILVADGLSTERSTRLSLFRDHAAIEQRQVDGKYKSFPLAHSFALGRWSRVLLRVPADGSKHVEIDGETVLDAPSATAWPVPSTSTRLYVGVNFSVPPTNGWQLAFDNVRFDGR